jgi:hypothetical protein
MAVIAGVLLPVNILNRRLRRRQRRGVRQWRRADQQESYRQRRCCYPSAPMGRDTIVYAGSVVPRHGAVAELAMN